MHTRNGHNKLDDSSFFELIKNKYVIWYSS